MTDENDQNGTGVDASEDRFPEWAMIIWGEIDADAEDAWNEWYDEVHIPKILECPGFIRAARYIRSKDSETRTFVTVYEVEGPAAFTTPELQKAKGAGPFVGKIQTRDGVYYRHKLIERGA